MTEFSETEIRTLAIEPPVPFFEGKPVDAATLRVSTGAALELDDEVVRMDDVITIQIEAVVEQVDHRVHRTSGRLIRYQVARPISARVVDGRD